MRPPKLRTTPLVQQLAAMQQATEANMKFAGLPRGTLRGTIKDVNDPENRGRVKVVFDDMNPDIPQVSGAGDWSKERVGSEPDLSHWIDVSPAFKGKQSPGLVGKRVNISVSNGQYQYSVLQDVLYDPELLAEKAQKNLKIPNNSSMTRLPIYPAGQLPPACEENHGCMVIEMDGPMDSDWACICLKRDGEYLWVRHADLSHGHAGGNDGTQQVDSLGNRQNPVMMGTVNDSVFPTTAKQFKQNSSYTTKPQGNPKGEASHWYPPPMSNKVYQPGQNFDLLLPSPNISLNFVRAGASFPSIDSVIAGFKPTFNPSIPSILEPKAKKVLEKAQKVLAVTDTVKGAVSDPTAFVKQQSLAAAQGVADQKGIPPGTEKALAAIQNPEGTLVTPAIDSVLPKQKGGVLGTLQNLLNSALKAATSSFLRS